LLLLLFFFFNLTATRLLFLNLTVLILISNPKKITSIKTKNKQLEYNKYKEEVYSFASWYLFALS